MSDIEYDDETPGIIETKKKKKSESNLKLGLLVGILATVALELIMGLALDTQGNLVHRYVAYMLGILILFVTAIITKSTAKMFFLATPIIIGSSFALPYFLPDIFSGLMAPFLNLLPIIDRMLLSATTFGLTIDEGTQGIIDLATQFGFVLDLVIAMFVGGLASLGISGILKILRGKVNFFTIFTISFTLLFFILGVIFLPYVIVILTGASQFAMTFGMGGIALTEGMGQIGSENGTAGDADAYFAEAKLWFIEAEQMLQGLEDLYLFNLIGQGRPSLIPIIENGLLALEAGIDLAQGVGPLLAGVTKITEGISEAMGVLDTSGTSLALNAFSSEDLTTFNNGLDLMELGFANITDAIEDVQSALTTINKIDQDEFNAALQAEAGTDLSNELTMINDAALLFNATLDVLKVLIETPNDGNRAPFIHLILGALSLSDASSAVGDTTSFERSLSGFENVIGNLTLVVNTFNHPAFDSFDSLVLSNGSQVIEVRDQISGMFEFIKDTGNIAIAVGEFGIIAPPTLFAMNDSISVFTEYDNFTLIPQSVYDEKILALDGVIANGSSMMQKGEETDDLVDLMALKSANGSYGMMDSAAAEFNGVFSEFNLTENGANFFYLATGFQNLMKTSKGLQNVDGYVANVETDMGVILANLSDFVLINASIGYMDANLTLADGVMNETVIFIAHATGNFSMVTGMPQVDSTTTALTNIGGHIVGIQGDMATILALVNDDLGWLDDALGQVTLIQTELDKINAKFVSINSELNNVDIAS